MDDKKIAFISCVNDTSLYSKCLNYINKLNIPKGYTIKSLSINDASSLCSGYNDALLHCDAKYKVYLHQDTYILNKNFISDILKIFQENKDVGMLGIIGCKRLTGSGIWWEAPIKYGQVLQIIEKDSQLVKYSDVGYLEDVQCVDGLVLITQYDIPWRDDLFDGWHFYDISHCMEMSKNNYRVCVPKQIEPWCLHDCGIPSVHNYHLYRDIFLKEYSYLI